MSGIVGIFNRNGAPAELPILQAMLEVLQHRGPNGTNTWTGGSVAFGHAMLRTTPESLSEHLPLAIEANRWAITAHARIDNRSEVANLLGITQPASGTLPDSELLLSAYQRWGVDLATKIIGDFAIVIWDGDSRTLYCARDTSGAKPLYYYLDDKLFLFASEPAALLRHPRVAAVPNEGMVAEYLSVLIGSRDETLWTSVMRLPPGEFLVVKPDRSEKRTYWRAGPRTIIRYSRDAEYAEHFRALLEDAVRARLRSVGAVGAHLSGGLDSSSIVALARNQNSVLDADFQVYSTMYPGQTSDESTYIDAMVRHCGLRSNRRRDFCADAQYFTAQARRYRDFVDYPTMPHGDTLRSLARESGAAVMLTGYGGDECLTWSRASYHDLIRQGKLSSLRHRIGIDLNEGGRWALAAQITKVPRLFRRHKECARPVLGINAAFAEKTRLWERVRTPPTDRRFAHRSQEMMSNTLNSGWWAHGNEIEERAAARFQIEQRDPFLDRRVVEFALALPEDQRRRRREDKFVLRHAMAGLLPPAVAKRRDKATFDGSFFQAMEGIGGRKRFLNLHSVQRGWVDADAVASMYNQLGSAYDKGLPLPFIFPLWMVAGIEFWLDSIR